MRPKFILPSIVAASMGTAAFAADKTYDFEDFDHLKVSSGVTVNVTRGDDYSVSADARRGNINRLLVSQTGDMLEISRKNRWQMLGLRREDKFIVYVILPTVENIRVSSGATVTAEKFDNEDFSAETASGSTLNVEKMQANDMTLTASSGSTLRIAGGCVTLTAKALSGSSLIASDMTCETVDADASSGSSLYVHATQSITAEASSGSSVRVSGKPIEQDTSNTSGGSVSVN